MTDLNKLREFAKWLIDEAESAVAKFGAIGAHVEVTRAEVATVVLKLLDEARGEAKP